MLALDFTVPISKLRMAFLRSSRVWDRLRVVGGPRRDVPEAN